MSEFKEGDKVRVKADCEKFLDGKMAAEIYVSPTVAGKIGKVKVAKSPFTSRAEVQFEDPNISQFIPRAWLELVVEEEGPIYFSDGGVWLGELSKRAVYVAPEGTPMPPPGVPIPPEWKPLGWVDPDEIMRGGDGSAECKLKDFPMGLGLPAVGEIKFEVPVDLPGELKETLDYQQAESDFRWGIEELMKHEATCTEDIFLRDVRATLFDRGEDYGGIEDNFADIAQMWGPIFGAEVRPDQVALAMIALKLVRANNGYKRDNAIDIAGYAVHLAEIQERQGR